jgi:hypothetical protein
METIWLLLTYVAGTGIGWYIGNSRNMEQTVGALIDRLIKDGYIKTKGHGSDAELLKHWEE